MRERRMSRAEAAGLLGVPVDADPGTVRHAWRMWARVAHPDVGGDPQHFARLETARRVLLVPVPVPVTPLPRATWQEALRRPHPVGGLALVAVAAVLLALLPAGLGIRTPGPALALAATPAAVAAGWWAARLTRACLGPRADRGHRIVLLGAAWLPVAVGQQVIAAIAAVDLVAVLPVIALPLVAAVASLDPGAGLWRPVTTPASPPAPGRRRPPRQAAR